LLVLLGLEPLPVVVPWKPAPEVDATVLVVVTLPVVVVFVCVFVKLGELMVVLRDIVVPVPIEAVLLAVDVADDVVVVLFAEAEDTAAGLAPWIVNGP